MLQKLRTDITKKLGAVNLLIINLLIFEKKHDGFKYKSFWNKDLSSSLTELEELDIEVVGFINGKSKAEKKIDELNIKKLNVNSDRAFEIFYGLEKNCSLKEVVFIGFEFEDIDIIRSSGFGITTSSAPLEVKMEADYVSNFDGIEAFEEVCNLIINAKSEPFGYSK